MSGDAKHSSRVRLSARMSEVNHEDSSTSIPLRWIEGGDEHIAAQAETAGVLKPLVALCAYTLLGAILFQLIDSKPGQPSSVQLQHECATKVAAVSAQRPGGLDASDAALQAAIRDCFELEHHPVLQTWSFDEALHFTIHVYTTAGFGSVCPYTAGGRLFSVLYGLLGVPLCNLLLLALSARWAHVLRQLTAPFSGNVALLGAHLLAVVTYMFVGAVIFTIAEGWTTLDAYYFSFNALSTVGLGDFVPRKSPFVVELVYTLGGQALAALFFNSLTNQYARVIDAV